MCERLWAGGLHVPPSWTAIICIAIAGIIFSHYLLPNQGVPGHMKILKRYGYMESSKGNNFYNCNTHAFSFLNVSLWEGVCSWRLKCWSSFPPPPSEFPFSCFIEKGMSYSHPASCDCAVPQGMQTSGRPHKKTIWNTVVNSASFDQGAMSMSFCLVFIPVKCTVRRVACCDSL